MCGTLCLDLIYISIKYHEDVLKIVYRRTDGRAGGQCHTIIRPFFQNGRKLAYKNEEDIYVQCQLELPFKYKINKCLKNS